MYYITGNNNGCDKITGECCKGCGPQETFINCADIAIDGDGGSNPATTKSPVPSTSTSTPVPTTTKTATKVTSLPSTTTKKSSTQLPTSSPKTSTLAPSTTPSTSSGNHNPTCAADEKSDCIGVGVYDGLGYESWCNIYCGMKSRACTADLCECRCRKAINCYAIGVFDTVPGMDDYCQENCQDGCADISHICKCEN